MLDVHRSETDVLNEVVTECSMVLKIGLEVPDSVVRALQNCEQRQHELQKLTARIFKQRTTRVSNLLSIFRFSLAHKTFERNYNMFKEDVLLLRSLCSE